MWLNVFSRKEGVSNIFSSHGLIRRRQLDYKVHCTVPFGAYCDVHDEPSPSNTSTIRTTGVIALVPNGNLQGGYFFMSLRTWKKLSRRRWTDLHVTDEIIRKVEERGIREYEELKSRKRGNNNEDRIIIQGEKMIFRDRIGKEVDIDPVTPS